MASESEGGAQAPSLHTRDRTHFCQLGRYLSTARLDATFTAPQQVRLAAALRVALAGAAVVAADLAAPYSARGASLVCVLRGSGARLN